MSNEYDKDSRLLIANEDLEQLKFFITKLEKIAVRVGNEESTPLFIANSSNFSVREIIVSNTNEVIISLSENLKGVMIKPRKIDRMSMSTITNGPKITYGKGSYFTAHNLSLGSNKDIFIKLESGNNILEIIEFN